MWTTVIAVGGGDNDSEDRGANQKHALSHWNDYWRGKLENNTVSCGIFLVTSLEFTKKKENKKKK